MIVGQCWLRAARQSAVAIAATLALTVSGLAEEAASDFKDRFAGDPFLGPIKVTATVPEEGEVIRDSGRASAQFIAEGASQLRLVVNGHIKEEGDAGFAVSGLYDKAGWRSLVDGVTLQVSPDGTISGGGEQAKQRLHFKGRVSESRFELTVDVTMKEATSKGLPPGTVFQYRYMLDRRKVSSAGESDEKSGECKRIVWQARNVAGFDGSMQMIQVPVCMKK
jgi:hypothetical protein